MKKKPPYNVNEKFFLIFNGEKVIITTKSKVKQTVQLDDDTEAQIEVPLTFDGYLLDMDEEYYYLGDSAAEVDKVVTKKDVIGVEIEKLKNVMDEILDDMGVPEENDIN